MAKGKKYRAALASYDRQQRYPVSEAINIVREFKTANYDQTVEVAVNLGVNPKYADQALRGAVVLPNGTGKTIRVAVFAKGDKENEAKEAGADFVGAEELDREQRRPLLRRHLLAVPQVGRPADLEGAGVQHVPAVGVGAALVAPQLERAVHHGWRGRRDGRPRRLLRTARRVLLVGGAHLACPTVHMTRRAGLSCSGCSCAQVHVAFQGFRPRGRCSPACLRFSGWRAA